MSDNAVQNIDPEREFTPVVEEDKKQESWGSFLIFLLKLVLAVLIFRSFIFAPFSIPSESMVPRLINGDQLIASKWSYGISNNSLPFGFRPFPSGRLFASQPERGDVAIFKHPLTGEDYIKRVIGLPGDEIHMQGGVLIINGEPVSKERVRDFEAEITPNTQCHQIAGREATRADGTRICRYMQFRETLPNKVSYNVIDFGPVGSNPVEQVDPDNTEPRIVPNGMLFMMGDNRDSSLDSRFPLIPGRGVGIVSQDLLVAKAQVMMWSTDGGAEWYLPWTWFTNTRWERIGGGI
jgi:signal peptidase I